MSIVKLALKQWYKKENFKVTCIIVITPSVSISLTLGTYGPATVEGGCLHGMLLGVEIIERLFLKQYLFCG